MFPFNLRMLHARVFAWSSVKCPILQIDTWVTLISITRPAMAVGLLFCACNLSIVGVVAQYNLSDGEALIQP